MKKIIAMLIAVCTVFLMAACSPSFVDIQGDKSKVSVGDEITFNVFAQNISGVSSCGFKLIYDTDFFELVSGEMCVDAAISDFSDSIGVIAFSNPVDIIDYTKIMTFKLKATASVKKSVISCEVSFKDADNQSIFISNVSATEVKVK